MLKAIKMQLILITIIVIFFLLAYIGVIPKIAELMSILKNIFNEYGIIAVMICAFFENIAGLNLYFPGSMVILFSMAMASGNPSKAFLLFLIIIFFSSLAHIINYLIFRLINFSKTEEKVNVYPSTLEFFLSFWHPHFAVIVSMKSGALKMPFVSFFKKMMVAMFCWYIFWTIIMYYAGVFTIEKSYMGLIWLFFIYLFCWIIWDIYGVIKKNRHLNSSKLV